MQVITYKHYLVCIPCVTHNQQVTFLQGMKEQMSEIVNLAMSYTIGWLLWSTSIVKANDANYNCDMKLYNLLNQWYVIHVMPHHATNY